MLVKSEFLDGLSDKRKLVLIPSIEEIMECLSEMSDNKLFGILLRAAEEDARRKITNAEQIMSPVKSTSPVGAKS